MKAPCLNCDKRCCNCHSTCEEYQNFRKWKDEDNEKIRKNKAINGMFTEMKNSKFNKRR